MSRLLLRTALIGRCLSSFSLASLALFSLSAAANEAQLEKGRVLVDQFVTGIDSLSASFSQTLIDADGAVLETSSGTLDVDRPGQFRWAYTEPYEQWLVADGVNIWSYDVDLAQVTVKPQADALANTPALLLGGSEHALDDFEFGGSFDEAGLTWVRLTPTDTEAGFRQVDLAFSNAMIARMVFLDNLEQTTIVSMQDVTLNGPVDAGLFDFEVPEGVDLVGTPAGVIAE